MQIRKNKAFTLIELLIVIVIIGILAGIILAVLNPARQQRRAREAVLQSSVNKLCAGLMACASTTTDATDCDDATGLGVTVPSVPTGAVYQISAAAAAGDTVTIDGTLDDNVGSADACVYTCSYNFGTAVAVSPIEDTAAGNCIIGGN